MGNPVGSPIDQVVGNPPRAVINVAQEQVTSFISSIDPRLRSTVSASLVPDGNGWKLWISWQGTDGTDSRLSLGIDNNGNTERLEFVAGNPLNDQATEQDEEEEQEEDQQEHMGPR